LYFHLHTQRMFPHHHQASNVGFELMSPRDIRQGGYLMSRNGMYTAVMQGDGNFVCYQGKTPFWASQTQNKGQGPFTLSVQQDGNLCVYDGARQCTWGTMTNGRGAPPYLLVMQDDRNLVLYSNDRRTALWASNTVSTTPYAPPPPPSELFVGQELHTDQSLVSRSSHHSLVMQGDGNLVLYSDRVPVWASQTQGKGMAPYTLRLQQDGNVVVYDRNNTPTWATGTIGKNQGPIRLVMQDDRNLCVYDSVRCIWASNTVGSGGSYRHTAPAELGEGGELRNDGTLVSRNGRYRLVMQGDGNLVGYEGGSSFWASQTQGKGRGPYKLAMQRDGNVVVYDSQNLATWATSTNGKDHGPYVFVMQDDLNIVLYALPQRRPIWASNTNV